MADNKKDKKEPVIIQTDTGEKNGQNKCPKCGATDISVNANNGKLRCNFCRHEFDPQKLEGMVEDINNLQGDVIASGATDIVADAKDVITFKCSSCGAEVVVDTASSQSARCHWCRNVLSVNEQIPNGAVPDVVLPFSIKKEEAQTEIKKFVEKRKFFAHPQFKKEFTTDNIIGVYFPYMLVDINAHSLYKGDGEHTTRTYYEGSGDNQRRYYDADAYHIEREFDLTINGLSIESNSDRLDTTSKTKTNNIINSIMPFDVENAVKFNANYTRGYNSEKRDINIDSLKNIVNIQAADISRFAANDSLQGYDRGVAWREQNVDIKGTQWKSAYLPVWLYSYQEKKNGKSLLHYVAVNARTKETMGSVPIHMPVLIGASFLVELLGVLGVLFVDWDYRYLFLLLGFIYFLIMYSRYRNSGARHTYESETKKNVRNLRKVDQFFESRRRLSYSRMDGANNTVLNGAKNKDMLSKIKNSSLVNGVADKDLMAGIVKDAIDKSKNK